VGLLAVALLAGCPGCGRAPSSRDAPALRSSRSEPPPLTTATAERVLEEARRPGARAVLVNVWASWCVPCREEFPDLVRLGRTYRDRGLRLVLVSANFPDEVGDARRFLAAQGVDFPCFIKAGDDMRFIDGLEPRWSGAIPATLLYDGQGRKLRFWEGRQSYETFERAVLEALQPEGRIRP
jgi:thiol-disulfide isomerase/thioredoxin